MSEAFEGKSVLVVDDDADIRTAIELAFKDAGANVATAGDGNTGMKMAQKDIPDLMILDEMLPQRSGLMVLQSLKAGKPPGTKPYVIMITANTGKRHQQCAEIYGVDDYINKPFPMEKLFAAAETLFAKG